jgi:hypothetical protein
MCTMGTKIFGVCQASKCLCGAADQPCCPPAPDSMNPDQGTCMEENTTCTSSPGMPTEMCIKCGVAGSICCAGKTCAPGSTCRAMPPEGFRCRI